MEKLIEKHQQKNKGRGKITTVDTDSGRTMFFSYDTPTRNKPVQTTAGRSPYQEIPRDVVANNLQSIEQQKRILDELDRNAEGIEDYVLRVELDKAKQEREEEEKKQGNPWYMRIPLNYAVDPFGGYHAYGPEQFWKDQTGEDMPYELKPTTADNVRVGLTGATALGLGAGLTQSIVLGTSLVGGALGDAAVNTGSRLLTGKSWADNVSDWTGMPEDLAAWTNPGMFYGGWVGNNFGHLGRYTLNYLDPRGYGRYFVRLKDVYTKPFYTKPPTFFNGRKPQWYGNQGFFNDDEIRFQNGAIWAGIPEKEVPRTLIQKNVDGTYRFTRGAIENAEQSTKIPFEEMAGLKDKDVLSRISEGQSINEQDWLTSVGGEHSDYILRQNNPRSLVWEFYDEQKLNPQWQLASKLKTILNLPDDSPSLLRRWIDGLGGANISWMLGYKPFTYRQGILLDKNSNWRLFFDPAHAERYGLGQTLME